MDSIGGALINTCLYVLDEDGQPVPVGVPGELYIGGAQLSPGHLHRPERTEERFVPNPFATESDRARGHTRMYKTGDVCRYLPSGELQYLRRNDTQVQLRGYRVELSEIAHTLEELSGIHQSVVVSQEMKRDQSTSQVLVAYVVADKAEDNAGNELVTEARMKAHLQEKLPSFMVPSAYVRLESFPRTAHGKLDLKALPNPEFKGTQYVTPRTDQEHALCALWQQTLKVPRRVGLADDFFELGGDSIVSIGLAHRMGELLGAHLSVADVFQHRTIQNLMDGAAQGFSLVKPYASRPQHTLPRVLFVHPAGGGSEVYQDLAEQLQDDFNCFGIDNYNMYHENKIASLPQLATHYLQQCRVHHVLDELVCLCGWSLGGHIAWQMAYLLEQQGVTQFCVVLLDPRLTQIGKSITEQAVMQILKTHAEEDYPADYAKRVLRAAPYERRLSRQPFDGPLVHSRVVLCKALRQDPRNAQLRQHASFQFPDSPSNGVEQYAPQVEVHRLDCTHRTIIEDPTLSKILRLCLP